MLTDTDINKHTDINTSRECSVSSVCEAYIALF